MENKDVSQENHEQILATAAASEGSEASKDDSVVPKAAGEASDYRIVDEGGQLSLFNFDAITSSSETKDKKDSGSSCGLNSEAGSIPAAEKKKIKGNSKSKSTKPSSPPKPELQSVKLGDSWKIHYAASVFEVDVLFQDELNNGVESVTLEEIRLKMVTVEDAAELTPSGTKWRYDIDNKQLFPDAWGQDKGVC